MLKACNKSNEKESDKRNYITNYIKCILYKIALKKLSINICILLYTLILINFLRVINYVLFLSKAQRTILIICITIKIKHRFNQSTHF